jgi:hypothetical protein
VVALPAVELVEVEVVDIVGVVLLVVLTEQGTPLPVVALAFVVVEW